MRSLLAFLLVLAGTAPVQAQGAPATRGQLLYANHCVAMLAGQAVIAARA
ncbi:hypothetical protein [Ramlibacter montanisoli]|uniref:Uncharacterized protein n=1 Tax=Ramlibacter montanisoli TaxID=2732512 RepID=A0A849K4I4_9BURK|nr:hypothetical protein [Ramlibacter montanisoli]NNU43342.1 hypothetical protein [Ramlibacter montanisoli]